MSAPRAKTEVYGVLHRFTFAIGVLSLVLLVVLVAIGLVTFGQTLFRTFDLSAPIDLDKAASLALVTFAVGITWWLVTHGEHHES